MTAKEAKQLSDLCRNDVKRTKEAINKVAMEGRTSFHTIFKTTEEVKRFLDDGGYIYEENKGHIIFIDWSNPQK